MAVHAPGRVNLLAVAMIAAVIAAIYWAVVIGPVFLERFDVVDQVSAHFNQLLIDPPEKVRPRLMAELGKIGSYVGVDEETGEQKTLPGLGVTDDDVIVEIENNEMRVEVTYSRSVLMPLLNKYHTERFVIRKTGKMGK